MIFIVFFSLLAVIYLYCIKSPNRFLVPFQMCAHFDYYYYIRIKIK